MKDWKKVYGSQETEPAEFDILTSATTIYQRRNVKRVETENFTGWEYEERELTKAEYEVVRIEQMQQQRADIDFIAAMTDVDLL